MKATHPDIDDKHFTIPQGTDECFEHFLEGFSEPRQAILAELSEGIAARHQSAVAVNSNNGQAYLLELSRFIVIYRIQPAHVEVATVLGKLNPLRPNNNHYFTSTLSDSVDSAASTHPDIAGKHITYVNLDRSFASFASDECNAPCPTMLTEEIENAIRRRHHEAEQVSLRGHQRPLWQLQTPLLRFHYQVLNDSIEVGTIYSALTGTCYEPGQDLLAEYTK